MSSADWENGKDHLRRIKRAVREEAATHNELCPKHPKNWTKLQKLDQKLYQCTCA